MLSGRTSGVLMIRFIPCCLHNSLSYVALVASYIQTTGRPLFLCANATANAMVARFRENTMAPLLNPKLDTEQ